MMLLAEIFIAVLLLIIAGVVAEHYTAVTKGTQAPPDAPPAVPPRGKARVRKQKAPPQATQPEQAKGKRGKKQNQKKEKKAPTAKAAHDEDTGMSEASEIHRGIAPWAFSPGDYLLYTAGCALWPYAKPYRYYIRIVLGVKLDEDITVRVLSSVCNVIYSLVIAIGFVTLPSQFMLRFTTATIIFGPACVSFTNLRFTAPRSKWSCG
jgi:hypothetical protein